MNRETELESFFSRAFEYFINEQLFYRSYQLDRKKMAEYINGVISIPISSFVEYLSSRVIPPYAAPQDIYQFSSLDDATSRFCSKLAEAGDEGLRYVDVGHILLDDGKERKSGALTKYGENHAKMAVDLGLAQNKSDYIFLSCLGIVFNDFSEYKREEILKRLTLRNRFIQRLAIKSQRGLVFLEEEMSCLSESTIKRRIPNIRAVFNLYDNDEMQLFKNIKGLNFLPEQLTLMPIVAETESDEKFAIKESDEQKLWDTFSHTASSYKYYWFLSILKLVNQYRTNGCGKVPILTIQDIMSGMIIEATKDAYAINVSDPLHTIVREVNGRIGVGDIPSRKENCDKLHDETFIKYQEKLVAIWHVVSYRFLSPWIPFSTSNTVAQKSREKSNTPYSFVPDNHNESILLNPAWEEYFFNNGETLRDHCRSLLNDYFSSKINQDADKDCREEDEKCARASRKKIKIVFSDGRSICPAKVADALVDLVNFAGPERVAGLNIICDDTNLVGKEKHPKYAKAQKVANDGWLVLTHSCTATKLKQMQSISNGLSLGLKFELVSD